MPGFQIVKVPSLIEVPAGLIEDRKIERADLGGIRHQVVTDEKGYTRVRLIGCASKPRTLEVADRLERGLTERLDRQLLFGEGA